MGQPNNFPEANIVFRAPDGMDDCDDIVAHKCEVGNTVTTCWRLDPDELEAVKRTGVVWLTLWGGGMQPASVGGLNPWRPDPDKSDDD